MTDCQFLTVAELEALTGISRSTWNKRRLTGEGPPWCSMGRTVRYRKSDVEAWIQERTRKSTSE